MNLARLLAFSESMKVSRKQVRNIWEVVSRRFAASLPCAKGLVHANNAIGLLQSRKMYIDHSGSFVSSVSCDLFIRHAIL